ncbi:MAG: helix-turn-helix domain-containing protein [Ferruginibacter sp.]
MRIIFIISIFFIQYNTCFSQGDTILSMVSSNPFYYNVLQDKNGTIFSGSSEGVQKWVVESGKYINNEKGYVEINNKGILEVRDGGIKKYENRKYNHLLPYPTELREQFYANTDRNLYIVTGGRLYIFDIVPYSISYVNHSIRSISNHYVATYSGIYYKGNKLKYPPYTEGYIREIGDTGYIFFADQLFLVFPDKAIKDSTQSAIKETLGEIFDISYDSQNQTIYYFCNNGIYKSDKNSNYPEFIYRKTAADPVLFNSQYENSLLFCSGNDYMVYDINSKKLKTIASLNAPIISTINLNKITYLLSPNELYAEIAGGKFAKVANFTDAHTLLALNDKELVIATNFGLYHYNLETREKQIVIRGVEFNKRALYLKNNMLYAGSINGLYKINAEKIQTLIENNRAISRLDTFELKWIVSITVLLIIIVILIVFLFRFRKQLINNKSAIIYEPIKKISPEAIEQFIKDNINTVSIKSINDQFQTNTIQLYNLLKPQKPGNIITDLRTELVIKLRNEGKSTKEISDATGFSESYIYRIRLKK